MTEAVPSDAARAARLKERIYITFTALAVLLALESHSDVSAIEALVTLAVAVFGTLLAILVADIISHIAVHRRVFDSDELRDALSASIGAIGAVTLPFVFLFLAALGIVRTDVAMKASAGALIAAFVVISYIAIRRVQLPAWQRAVSLLAAALLGIIVVGLELLAHG